MVRSKEVAVVAVFTALIVGSDYALTGLSNIKLMDTIVFVSAYLFGFRVGALVGILSESIWSFASPIGVAWGITPFLVGGELLFALAGWAAARVWGRGVGLTSPASVFFGALLAICAFLWDLETNLITALIGFWPAPTLGEYLFTAFGPFTLPFIIAHEGSDFLFGMLLAPLFIVLIPRVMGGTR